MVQEQTLTYLGKTWLSHKCKWDLLYADLERVSIFDVWPRDWISPLPEITQQQKTKWVFGHFLTCFPDMPGSY